MGEWMYSSMHSWSRHCMEWLVSLMPQALYLLETSPHYLFDKRLGRPHSHSRGRDIHLSLLRIKLNFLSDPACSLVTILTELPQPPVYKWIFTFIDIYELLLHQSWVLSTSAILNSIFPVKLKDSWPDRHSRVLFASHF